jgi:oxalate decarboxylase/phosphoglucose isomerase-like protein (cupin superfamily)
MIVTKIHKELEDVLFEPKAPGVKESYYTILGDGQNITIINPGKNGVEFNKTYGHVNRYQGAEMYQCLSGQGIVVMERLDENGNAKEFRVATLSSGKQVEVPAGYGHCVVNVGKGYLVVLDNAPGHGPKYQNYEPIKEKKGFAYYIVEKKGEIGFERNSNYSIHPQITTEY